jgi:hypothetical protein
MIKRKLSLSIIALIFNFMTILLQGQQTSDGSMTQYHFPEFSAGRIFMKNGQTHTSVMNYNTVTEKMVFIKDDSYFDLTNTGMIDTIILQDIRFVPVGKAFYEVLISDSSSLYIQYKGELLPAGKPVGYGGTSHLASSTYLSSVDLSGGRYNLPVPPEFTVNMYSVYWIRKGTEWSGFVNEKQFLKLFPEKAGALKAFIKKNRIKIDRKKQMIELMEYCNSLN